MVVYRSGSRALALGVVGVLAAAAAILVMANDAEATHFFGGSMAWSHETVLPSVGPVGLPNPIPAVTLDLELSLRSGYFCFNNCVVGQRFNGVMVGSIDWGDGSPQTSDYEIEVTSVNGSGHFVARAYKSGTIFPVEHQYMPGKSGPFVITWGQSCCRASIAPSPGHRNNPDQNYQLQSVVTLVPDNHSPHIAFQPVVTCAGSGLCSFPIPATDADGDPLSYRFSTGSEATGAWSSWYIPGPCPRCGSPATASLDPTSGAFSWDTTGASAGLYSVQAMVEDGHGSSVVDFFIRVLQPPACTPSSIGVQTGQTVSFTSSGSGNSWNAPGGNPSSGAGSSFSTSYSQAGSYAVTVSNAGGSATCSVTVSDPTPNLRVASLVHAANANHLAIEVTVQDQDGVAVDNVTVTVQSCDASQVCTSLSGITDADGIAKVKWHQFPGAGTYTTCVTSVSKAGWHEATDAQSQANRCATVTV